MSEELKGILNEYVGKNDSKKHKKKEKTRKKRRSDNKRSLSKNRKRHITKRIRGGNKIKNVPLRPLQNAKRNQKKMPTIHEDYELVPHSLATAAEGRPTRGRPSAVHRSLAGVMQARAAAAAKEEAAAEEARRAEIEQGERGWCSWMGCRRRPKNSSSDKGGRRRSRGKKTKRNLKKSKSKSKVDKLFK